MAKIVNTKNLSRRAILTGLPAAAISIVSALPTLAAESTNSVFLDLDVKFAHCIPASAIALSGVSCVTNVHRRAIMNAARRTRRSLDLSMTDAMKTAWAAFRRAQRNHWPTDHIMMPFEQIQLPRPYFFQKTLMTRQSGQLARSFLA